MMNKLIKILILCFLPSFASSRDISETGWFLKDADGDEKIIIFRSNQTFAYLKLTSHSGNEGKLYSDDDNTWLINNDLIILSFTDGYMICQLNLINVQQMSGTCLNELGVKDKVKGSLIK